MPRQGERGSSAAECADSEALDRPDRPLDGERPRLENVAVNYEDPRVARGPGDQDHVQPAGRASARVGQHLGVPGHRLPRSWDDSEREPDEHPHDQLLTMFRRVKAALHAWAEVMDHLT